MGQSIHRRRRRESWGEAREVGVVRTRWILLSDRAQVFVYVLGGLVARRERLALREESALKATLLRRNKDYEDMVRKDIVDGLSGGDKH